MPRPQLSRRTHPGCALGWLRPLDPRVPRVARYDPSRIAGNDGAAGEVGERSLARSRRPFKPEPEHSNRPECRSMAGGIRVRTLVPDAYGYLGRQAPLSLAPESALLAKRRRP